MNKKERKAFNKYIQKQEKAKNAKLEQQRAEEQSVEEPEESAKGPAVELGKTNRLVFFRQYNTYQALLEVHPSGALAADDVYRKVILYIMRWFRNRLGEEAYKEIPDIAFLWDLYPDPEKYELFDPEGVSNINGFDFIDFESVFLNDKNAWVVRLTEPDNGKEQKDIHGRTFTTGISVYKQESSVVLGIRESCREPEANTEDAIGYRPGFVRDMFYDPDLILTEQGIDTEFSFAHQAYRLNGKSAEACKRLYDGLIASNRRQMPVLFVPGEYYEKHAEETDKKTESLVGYCHVIVCENGCRKLFEQVMDNVEFAEVAEEGQLIFYRTNCLQEYPSAYFEDDSEDLLDNVKFIAQSEPLRKVCDFRAFSFETSGGISAADVKGGADETAAELLAQYEAEIAGLQTKVKDLERDNDLLQRRIDAIESENKKLDKEIRKSFSEISKNIKNLDEAIAERDRVKDDLNRLREETMRESVIVRSMIRDIKERYKPLLNLPPLSREKKAEILDWIREYYSDVLVIHPKGEALFFDDKRNIDWHRFCMMIHYIAGYTRYRNEGGIALDSQAARDYDVEDSAYTVEPSGSGLGALEMHKDEYTITISEGGESREVLMDMHVKYGKGMDSNMIRIYFHYSGVEKKTFIGAMPGHLSIRNG